MFLGTSFLFAILHSKIGLLTNALSDKSLVLRGRAKVGEERSKMGVNRRQTATKPLVEVTENSDTGSLSPLLGYCPNPSSN